MRVLCCDIGNVVMSFDNRRAVRQLLALSGRRQSGELDRLNRDATKLVEGPLWQAYGDGSLDDAGYRAEVRRVLKVSKHVSDADIDQAVSDVFTPNMHTIRILERLREEGVILVAVTNAEPPRVRFQEGFGLWQLFHHRVASCEVRLCKPDPAIFRHALGLVKAQPWQAGFTDDVPEYVAVATKLGLAAHHYKGPAGFEHFLRLHGHLTD